MVMTSNQVLVIEHLKVLTQLIVVAIPQFSISNYLPLILPENKEIGLAQFGVIGYVMTYYS